MPDLSLFFLKSPLPLHLFRPVPSCCRKGMSRMIVKKKMVGKPNVFDAYLIEAVSWVICHAFLKTVKACQYMKAWQGV